MRGLRPTTYLDGQKFGRWTVLVGSSRNSRGMRLWTCRCECGNVRDVVQQSLIHGLSRSCGCLHNELVAIRSSTHGHSRVNKETSTHRSWRAMRARCEKENSGNYKYYGGRGICVCERWEKFENFLEDMGERPAGMTIDRIDNDGPYDPDNCQWSTSKKQMHNQRLKKNATGFTGVTKYYRKYRASIGINGKRIHLGLMGTPEEAHAIYMEALNAYRSVN